MAKVAKLIIALALLALLLAFGCTQAQGDQQVFTKLSQLQDKYFVKENYSTTDTVMNNYLIGLASLRAESGGSAAKVIDAEIYSAQTFFYLNRAVAGASAINYLNIQCSSKETKTVQDSAKLALENSQKAISAIQGLSDTEKTHLRQNQFELVKNYQANAEQIQSFFSSKC